MISTKYYTIGSLRYDLRGLILLFSYLLWGGFSYSILAYALIPTLLPLILDQRGASGALIGLIVGSIPAAMNMVMNPILGTNSDRTRTRWGRRIPYLAFAAPFVTAFMIIIGFAPEISVSLEKMPGFRSLPSNTICILIICIAAVLFQFFNLIVGSIYYYLLPDVIPTRFLGNFMSLLNIAFALASFIFNYFLMEYARNYMGWIFMGVGIFFLGSFLIVCSLVKEGDYPPPEPLTKSDARWFQRCCQWLIGYFKSSFHSLFFVMLFFGTALNQVSTACRSIFNLLFATKELGITEAEFGQIMGYGALLSLAVVVIVGFWMEKLHPLRIYIFSALLVLPLNFFGFFWVYNYHTFLVVGLLIAIVYSVQSLSNIPLFAKLFPAKYYGQYSSANAMVNSVLMIVANWCGGVAIDYFGYRFIFIWDIIFTLLALAALGYVYIKWRQMPREVR